MWEGGRTWVAVDDGQICGTFRSWPTELTVPGLACLPAAGVSAVTVLPTHRRRGVLRSMTATEHAAIRESGQVFGLLHALEYWIYGRFGYGPGTREATWMLDAERTTFHGSPEGSVELVTPGDEARAALSSVFDAWRVGQVGEIRRRDHSWDFDLGLRDQFWEPKWSGFLALHRNVAGEVDGYARYRAEERWEQRQPRNTLQVDELHGLTLEASAALWRFLAEIDWVATVKASRRSPSDPLPWLLTNGRAAAVSDVGDGIWVRIFDVPACARDADIRSGVARRAGGCRRRSAGRPHPGRPRCQSRRRNLPGTDQSPDLTLDVAALGTAYLGGTRLRDAVQANGVDEHRNGALAAVEALLRTPDEPWCSTFF